MSLLYEQICTLPSGDHALPRACTIEITITTTPNPTQNMGPIFVRLYHGMLGSTSFK